MKTKITVKSPAGTVIGWCYFREECKGSGWVFNMIGRSFSRVLHATPEKAVSTRVKNFTLENSQ